MIARERKPKDVHEQRSLQVIKAVTYVLLFCILLFCAVAQKIALAILTADQFNVTSTRTASDHEVSISDNDLHRYTCVYSQM